jgi:hypothetical protein
MQRRLAGLLVGAALGGFAYPILPAAAETEARIEVVHEGNVLSFTALAHADAVTDVRYELTAIKSGTSGRSRSRQAGRSHVVPQTPSRLSQTRLSVEAGDEYCVELTLYENGTPVSRSVATPAGVRNALAADVPESCGG